MQIIIEIEYKITCGVCVCVCVCVFLCERNGPQTQLHLNADWTWGQCQGQRSRDTDTTTLSSSSNLTSLEVKRWYDWNIQSAITGTYNTTVSPRIPIISAENATRGNSLKTADRRSHYISWWIIHLTSELQMYCKDYFSLSSLPHR